MSDLGEEWVDVMDLEDSGKRIFKVVLFLLNLFNAGSQHNNFNS